MSAATQELICPKCGSAMRSYERNGITVDQCTGCKGVFLDRGELEHLVDAEGAHYEREFEQRSGKHEDKSGQKPKSKKKSFLENLLEMGGE